MAHWDLPDGLFLQVHNLRTSLAGGTIDANGGIFSNEGDLTISGGSTLKVTSGGGVPLLSGSGKISISGGAIMEATATVTNTVPIVADFGSGNAIEITDGAQVTATSVDVYVLSAKSGAIRIADSGINPDTGPKSGNTPVTVTGTNLSGVTKIQHPATRQISHCLSAGYTSYNPETGR